MTLLRLMLGGAGGFTPPVIPVLSPYTLTSAPEGAVNIWQTPGAFSHGGVTYFPFVDGSVGNLKVGVFDETAHTVAVYIIVAAFEKDAHSSPTLHRRVSDGLIMAAFSKHNNSQMNVRIAANPDDVSSWSTLFNIDSQLGGTRYTDSQLYEVGGNLILFYRDEPSAGTDSRWCISTTSAATPGTGWAAQTIVYRINSTRSYVISAIDQAAGLIHFIATSSGSGGYTSLGHFYLDVGAGTYHKSDGTTITLPLNFSSITPIYTGTGGAFPANVVIDASGYPVVAGEDTISGALRNIYVRFDGASWSSTNVSAVGTGYEYSGPGTGFASWGQCVDDGDPDVIYCLEDTGGFPEVHSHTTADGGATFDDVQITFGATTAQHTLACIRNPSADLRAYWDFGSWTTYKVFNVGLRGLGF